MIKAKIVGKRDSSYGGKNSLEIYLTFEEEGVTGLRTCSIWMSSTNDNYAEVLKLPVGTEVNIIRVGFGKNQYYHFLQVVR